MEITKLAAAVARFLCRLMPLARMEIDKWRARAEAIEDPVLRGIALAKIREERANVESAAFFALLAGEDWRQAVRRIVAFQLVYEYLDGVSELRPQDGDRLHGALIEAVGGERRDHGGGSYVQALADACRRLSVPSSELAAAAADIGAAQTRNHIDLEQLRTWAERIVPSLPWWEGAAAGISSLAVLAMLATPAETHGQIRRSYVEIRALSALLDGLVDYDSDLPRNHNWVSHYDTPAHMADRLETLTSDAAAAIEDLPDELLHRLLLAGLIAHNLAVLTHSEALGTMRARLTRSARFVAPAVLMLRLRRTIQHACSYQRRKSSE